jgi:rhodanese-related sulfurtransferase
VRVVGRSGWIRALAIAGCAFAAAGAASAFSQDAPDPWQTFMDAAALAVAERDDQTAALALAAAKAVALADDPRGMRARYTFVELFYVHKLLKDEDAANEDRDGFHATKDAGPDERVAAFADTGKKFADAFLKRRNDDFSAPPAIRTLLADAAGMNSEFRVDILDTLRPDDKAALAEALLDQGKANEAIGSYAAAVAALRRAIDVGDQIRKRRETLRAASRALSPAATGAKSMPTDVESDQGGAVAFEARSLLMTTEERYGASLASDKPDEAAAAYRRSIEVGRSALPLYAGLLEGGDKDAKLYRVLGWDWNGLCRLATTKGADHAECEREGAAAFEQAASILAARWGPGSSSVVAIVNDYERLLFDVDEDPRAAEVEARFGVDRADEKTDFNVEKRAELQPADRMATPTPASISGARILTTAELLPAVDRGALGGAKFHLIDVKVADHEKSLPGAVRLPDAGAPGDFADATQTRVEADLRALAGDHQDAQLVFFGEGARSWDAYNAALRAAKLGYANVYWYRGGLAAWTSAWGAMK